DWAKINLSVLFDAVDASFEWMVESLTDGLLSVPALALILVFAAIGWVFRSWQLAIGTVLSFLLIVAMDQWEPAMQTLALVAVAAVIAVAIAVPLGILM